MRPKKFDSREDRTKFDEKMATHKKDVAELVSYLKARGVDRDELRNRYRKFLRTEFKTRDAQKRRLREFARATKALRKK